jgi:hypothetical protein
LLELVQSGTSVKVAASAVANSFSGTLSVAHGGTGVATLTSGQYLKGAGTSAVTSTATIPYNDLSGRAYLSAYSALDQTGSTSAGTAVVIGTTSYGSGISMTTNGSGNYTRITFTDAGTYCLMPSLQFANSAANNYNATVWFKKNGTDIASSATVINVPKAADGGNTFFQIALYEQVTAGQYVEVYWLPANTAVTLDYIAATATAPAAPSVILSAERIA